MPDNGNSETLRATAEKELERLVLKETIVSATGLNGDQLQVGIKGDPSLRETVDARHRYASRVDELGDALQRHLIELLRHRGTYRLFIGCNNGEIRTVSIFDPLREEIHDAARITDRRYLDRHFPVIPFEEKISAMRELYRFLFKCDCYRHVPPHWRNIIDRRHASWQPMEYDEIPRVVNALHTLRELPHYYLRNMTISVVQAVVRLQFNCDGTQIVRAGDLPQFLEDNLP